MRPSTFSPLAAALVLVVSLPSPPAQAQDLPRVLAITAGSVFGAADIFFIAYDLTVAERNKSPARAAVAVEIAAMTLQLASGISMFATGLQSEQRLDSLGVDRDLYLPLGAVLAVLAAPLMAHGIRHSVERVGSGIHTLNLVPVHVGDQRGGGTGLALIGRF